ncbi:hypothetical protein SDC9_39591 [bioreactor metagenome]|uniref:Uncharacterized protein n=1 Tax=bioreactor metagenome TaxID=1076179 RepID=A0A644VSS9_9ZZZZ
MRLWERTKIWRRPGLPQGIIPFFLIIYLTFSRRFYLCCESSFLTGVLQNSVEILVKKCLFSSLQDIVPQDNHRTTKPLGLREMS